MLNADDETSNDDQCMATSSKCGAPTEINRANFLHSKKKWWFPVVPMQNIKARHFILRGVQRILKEF
jgi:hypothetical protein